MSEAEERARVIAETRGWIGTPYVHEGRIKQVVADCTFISKPYEAAGLIAPVKIPHYSPQAHLNREAGHYRRIVEQYARETDAPKAGDIVLYFIGRDWSHGAIVVDPGWPAIVHADIEARCVLEAFGDRGRLVSAPRAFFTIWP